MANWAVYDRLQVEKANEYRQRCDKAFTQAMQLAGQGFGYWDLVPMLRAAYGKAWGECWIDWRKYRDGVRYD